MIKNLKKKDTYMSQHLTISLHLYTEHLVVPQNTLIHYKITMFHYAAT